ncbi:MAG: HDOD domain-containing protein [Proteobacteria bacterium]|nr:HDOD domain-containing protein [Pseudomonadota bacterium]MBU1582672.1 HDOD domain-containing protein [Pseudomonadota bacterium]MBU2453343.1 HDOD domain-containing protein [Pseudomonadota bacterium]MBU2629660.1 HDOD domain-containing protein [Pseudomonadota bacterium]
MSPIQKLIKDIKNLKPIPAVINQILEVVDKPNSSLAEIANIIQYDPAVTASILRTCNSAFFGLKNPAESIKDAVSMLGIDQILEIVLMKSGAKVLSGKQIGYGLHEGAMWKYSVSSALIAKQIAVKLSMENKNTIFTAALLKDIGKTVLDRFVMDSFEKISSLVVNENLTFREAEKKIIGVDHAELGGMIAKMWKFSPRMVKIIRHHHLTDASMVKDKEIAVVYLADCICVVIGIGVGSDGVSYRFNDQAMKELGMEADDISKIISRFAIHMQEVENLLKVV